VCIAVSCSMNTHLEAPCKRTTILGFLFLFLAQQSPLGHDLLTCDVSRSHTTKHHSRWDSSGRVISSSQRPLPDNTQHPQQTFMPPVGFEPTISACERPQTYALDRAASGTGKIVGNTGQISANQSICSLSAFDGIQSDWKEKSFVCFNRVTADLNFGLGC